VAARSTLPLTRDSRSLRALWHRAAPCCSLSGGPPLRAPRPLRLYPRAARLLDRTPSRVAGLRFAGFSLLTRPARCAASSFDRVLFSCLSMLQCSLPPHTALLLYA